MALSLGRGCVMTHTHRARTHTHTAHLLDAVNYTKDMFKRNVFELRKSHNGLRAKQTLASSSSSRPFTTTTSRSVAGRTTWGSTERRGIMSWIDEPEMLLLIGHIDPYGKFVITYCLTSSILLLWNGSSCNSLLHWFNLDHTFTRSACERGKRRHFRSSSGLQPTDGICICFWVKSRT